MRILQVIHGFPPYYMAGSEVYTFNLAAALAKQHEVCVFTRMENPFLPAYSTQDETRDKTLSIRWVNKPFRDYTYIDKFLDPEIDKLFRQAIEDFRPDVVHFGHLSHLSTELPVIAKREYGIPVIFTLHDFWMGCIRGQRVDHLQKICPGPSTEKCLACLRANYKESIKQADVEIYFRQMARVFRHVDCFLSPSHVVRDFMISQGVSQRKIIHSRYGFKTEPLLQLGKDKQEWLADMPICFGFIGRIIPVKGIDLLIRAFKKVRGDRARLKLFGDTGNNHCYIESLAAEDKRISLCGGFDNQNLADVLKQINILVVPSLWLENSPLVIQEALLAGRPSIATNLGGMAELIQHGHNGYLFPLHDEKAFTQQMQAIVDNPNMVNQLKIVSTDVRTIDDDAQNCVSIYRKHLSPRRITFVTNPGLCNLSCIMCDTHSKHNPRKSEAAKEFPILPFELIEQTVCDLVPLGLEEIIPSTMGEPLLYPDFDKILDLVSRTGIRLNLTTNGSFPRRGVRAWAEKLLPVLSDIKISVNAIDEKLNDEIMCGIGKYDQLENIKKFISLRDKYECCYGRRITVTLQVTFMKRNLKELEKILRWGIENGVDRFKGHHMWKTWPALENESLMDDKAGRCNWNQTVERLKEISQEQKSRGGRIVLLENITPVETSPSSSRPKTRCPFLKQEAWIEADGRFHVCCCPSTVREQFGSFGTIHNTPLRKLWRSQGYQSFVDGWGKYTACKSCNMRKKEEC